jgi:acetyl esterase/lipase
MPFSFYPGFSQTCVPLGLVLCRMTKAFPFLLLLLLAMQVAAQPKVLKLYPDGNIPLSKPCSVVEKMDTSKEGYPGRISKVVEPSLWFYPSKSSQKGIRRTILVIPGGGYSFVSVDNEGRKMGERLSYEGYDVFVLVYRLPLAECQTEIKWVPLTDAMAAMKRICDLGYDKIGLIGFSAGGHLASSLSTLNEKNPHHPAVKVPDAACLVYPVVDFEKYIHTGSRKKLLASDTNSTEWVSFFSTQNQVSSKTPPTILIHSVDDKSVPWQNSLLYSEALIKAGIKAEFHLFPSGGHGYGLGPIQKNDAPDWLPLVLDFFKTM